MVDLARGQLPLEPGLSVGDEAEWVWVLPMSMQRSIALVESE